MKSFVPKDGGGKPPSGTGGGGRNAERNFHGEKRKNDTHSSTTDPDARLFRKGAGKAAKLCHMGHLMTENRHGLIVDARLTEANGTAERSTALDMIEDNAKPGSTVDVEDPTKVGGEHADFVPGLFAAHATMIVLWSARSTGMGQYVDVAMVDSVLALCELISSGYSFDGQVPRPAGSRLPPVAPFGRVRCKDGYVVFGITPGGPLWHQFCEAWGRPELRHDERFATPTARVKKQDALYALIEDFTLRQPKLELMQQFGGKVPFGPVYDAADIAGDPHFAARNMLPFVEQPG